MITEVEFEDEVVEAIIDEKKLIVYNDDFNTFDYVIESLVNVCNHHTIQAEQCTWIIHYNGKCQVKQGNFESLEPMCVALLDRGITAKIE